MKQKKGFTVIELIAIITILAILVVLIAPSILDASEASKKKLKQSKIETITYAAGNLAEDNTEKYSICNSHGKVNKDNCFITIDELISQNYLDLEAIENGKNVVIDPTTDTAIPGGVLVCYNMNTGLFTSQYYEAFDSTTACANTGLHTLTLKDNSTAISWHEIKTFTTDIFTSGEFTEIGLLDGTDTMVETLTAKHGVTFTIKDKKELQISYTGTNDIIQKSEKIEVTIRGKYTIDNIDHHIDTRFTLHLYDETTDSIDILAITIRPTKLMKDVTGITNDITLSCIQKNSYGCEITIEDYTAYYNLPNLTEPETGYRYIENYLEVDDDYYVLGAKQNGTIYGINGTNASTTYRMYKNDADKTNVTYTLKDGTIIYVGVRPIELTVTLAENPGKTHFKDSNGIFEDYKVKLSPTSKQVVYTKKYGQQYESKNNIKSVQEVKLPSPTRKGYTFAGWSTKASGGASVTDDTTVDRFDEHTIYATWTPNIYNYKVLHYKQNISGNGYFLADEETGTANFDSEITPTIKTYAGFTSPTNTKTIVIDVDGNVVKYYYTRNKYPYRITHTFMDLNGSYTIDKGSTTGEAYFESTVEAPVLSPVGFTAPARSDITIQIGTADTNSRDYQYSRIKYEWSVTHQKQTLQGGYEIAGTGGGSAFYEAEITPDVNSYTGFTSPNAQKIQIGTGTNSVTYNYTRNSYSYTVNHNKEGAGTETETGSALYEQQVEPSVKSYYGFDSPSTTTITINTSNNVVNYSYTRKSYSVSCSASGGTASGGGTVKYEGRSGCSASPDAQHRSTGSGGCSGSAGTYNGGGSISIASVVADTSCTITFEAKTCPAGTSGPSSNGTCSTAKAKATIYIVKCATSSEESSGATNTSCGSVVSKEVCATLTDPFSCQTSISYYCPNGWYECGESCCRAAT